MKPVAEMSIVEVIAELRDGKWVSSRNEEEWNRRMHLWTRLDAHVANEATRQSSR